MKHMGRIGMLVMAALMAAGSAMAGVEPAESARMLRAKDLISDERWDAAILELRSAIADSKEQNKDEALFWLATSQNQTGDLAEAIETVQRLQRDYPKSRWTVPASSLMIELAQKTGRRDWLWRYAAPPAPPPTPPVPASTPPPTPLPPRAPRTGPTPAAAPPRPTTPPDVPPSSPPLPPGATWVAADSIVIGADLRIQALARLIPTDAKKVIPMLRNIAFHEEAGPAKRAVLVLAQSRNPDAQVCVVDVAKSGPEPVRIAAVRELGRFGDSNTSRELLEVYSTANWPVKRQVVLSLGERADTSALLRIAQSESDVKLLETAIVTLGRAGGSEQLRVLYPKSTRARQLIIRSLYNARDEDGLIRIAKQEKDAALRDEALARLRLLGTPGAKAYLESIK